MGDHPGTPGKARSDSTTLPTALLRHVSSRYWPFRPDGATPKGHDMVSSAPPFRLCANGRRPLAARGVLTFSQSQCIAKALARQDRFFTFDMLRIESRGKQGVFGHWPRARAGQRGKAPGDRGCRIGAAS